MVGRAWHGVLIQNLSYVLDVESNSDLETQGGCFIDIVSRKGIQAAIRLHNGEIDTQESHSVDEVYYVIEGKGLSK